MDTKDVCGLEDQVCDRVRVCVWNEWNACVRVRVWSECAMRVWWVCDVTGCARGRTLGRRPSSTS